MQPSEPTPDPSWSERERYWRRRLGRLRLGVEPLSVQLERYRQVTWMLTAVPLVIGLMFLALFTAFRRPDVALWIIGLLLVPIVALAWLDFVRLRVAARAYEKEKAEFDQRSAPPNPT